MRESSWNADGSIELYIASRRTSMLRVSGVARCKKLSLTIDIPAEVGLPITFRDSWSVDPVALIVGQI